MQTVNLSATDLLEHLSITLPCRWTQFANEIDVACFDNAHCNVGYIVTLQMHAGNYSFKVVEIPCNKSTGEDCLLEEEFPNYDKALNHIRQRMDIYLNNF